MYHPGWLSHCKDLNDCDRDGMASKAEDVDPMHVLGQLLLLLFFHTYQPGRAAVADIPSKMRYFCGASNADGLDSRTTE